MYPPSCESPFTNIPKRRNFKILIICVGANAFISTVTLRVLMICGRVYLNGIHHLKTPFSYD